MKGLEILVTNSDLVLKQEERLVKLFVIFKDKKYGTKYIIFSDNMTKELCYGSPLVNGNKMVIMKFKNIKDAEMVKEFVWNYLNDKQVSNFEIIEVPKIDKLEIIDNNTLDVKEEYLKKLDDIFFKKENIVEKTEEVRTVRKSSKASLLFTILLLLVGVGGFIYLKNNPELIYGKEIYVECKTDYSIEEISSSVNEIVTLTFNNSQVLKKHEKEITYLFIDNDKYYDFKEKNLQYKYLKDSGNEKFIDEDLSYKLFVDYKLNNEYLLPKGYDELFDYYKNNGYSCNNIQK